MHLKGVQHSRFGLAFGRARGRKIFGRFELIEFLRLRLAFSYARVSAHDAGANGTCVPSELWVRWVLPLSLSLSYTHTHTRFRTHTYGATLTARVRRFRTADGLRDLGIGLRPRNDYR